MMETDLRTFLLYQDPLTALVGQRVYGMMREQGLQQQLPAVMIQRISSARQVKFCATDKLVDADMQIDAYAISGDSAWAVANVLRSALLDFSGMMGETHVDKVLLANEFPLIDPDPGIVRVTQLYNFWYVED